MPRALPAKPAVPVLAGNLEAWLAALAATLSLAAIGFSLGCAVAGAGPWPAPEATAVSRSGDPGVPGRSPPARRDAPHWLAWTAPAQVPGMDLPMVRPVADGWVSSAYGPRRDPISGLPAHHAGLDFTGSPDSAILAVAPGVVAWSGPRAGYGNLIEIDHGNGWVTRYGHNARNLVAPGDYVKPGQTIALMGATGRATGTHLHFEVRYQGRAMNPARVLPPSA